MSRPPPAAVGDPSRGATAPYHGTLLSPRRRLTRTEPANHEPAHPTWSPRPGSDFRTNVPGDDPSSGARRNIRVTQPPPSPGPKARATKNYDLRAYPFVTRNDTQLSYKAYHVAPHLHEQRIVSDISSTFRTLHAHFVSLAPVTHPVSPVYTPLVFLSCRCALSIRTRPLFFCVGVRPPFACRTLTP